MLIGKSYDQLKVIIAKKILPVEEAVGRVHHLKFLKYMIVLHAATRSRSTRSLRTAPISEGNHDLVRKRCCRSKGKITINHKNI